VRDERRSPSWKLQLADGSLADILLHHAAVLARPVHTATAQTVDETSIVTWNVVRVDEVLSRNREVSTLPDCRTAPYFRSLVSK
jgi:hypothetical protein